MPEGVAGDGFTAEAAHDECLSGRLETGIQLLVLAVKQCPGATNKQKNKKNNKQNAWSAFIPPVSKWMLFRRYQFHGNCKTCMIVSIKGKRF